MTKENKKIEIRPTTSVHDLLEAYPQLEDVLIEIAPAFKKLKNPILRKSVAKVATLKHAASVGNTGLDDLINKLRKEVGQSEITESFDEENYFQPQPDWFSADRVTVTINEGQVKNRNKMTLAVILEEARNVEKDDIIELVTSFLPAPGIDYMKSHGYLAWSVKQDGGIIKSYFLKQ